MVEETKILGIMLSSDLKWKKHVEFVRKKCLKKMWSLRRMKEIGGSNEDMIDVFTLQIRCLAEIGCPSWNGALTQKDITKLESIQKVALRIMLGERYKGYENALKTLNLSRLDKRRETICKKFARKMERSSKFANWLKKAPRINRFTQKYSLPNTRTMTYRKSPLFYLTNLLT